ncbi:MAG: hypothetical protein RR585_04530 [Coprobacillus sp.]
MLTLKDLVEEYADMPLNDDVIRLFGIVEPKEQDCTLRIQEVQKILGVTTGSVIIKKLKHKYQLNYDEPVIPASIIAKEYGMKTKDIINYAKEKADAGTSTSN